MAGEDDGLPSFSVEHVAAGRRKRTELRLCCVRTVETVRISTR
jgi:hypothetical protein